MREVCHPPRLRRTWVWLLAATVVLLTAWVLCVSRPGVRVEGCPAGCAVDGSLREGPLRVVSLNMLHGFPRFSYLDQRIALILDGLEHLHPDIVCLQEVPWRPGIGTVAEHLANELGYNHIYVRARGNRMAILFEEGEAILSRYPLRDVGFVELTPRANFFEHRVVLHAIAATPWGDVQVFATHLTHSDPEVNRQQVAALQAYVAETGAGVPAIVAGDFNAPEDSDQVADLVWLDTHRAAHPDDPGYTCCVDTVTAGPGARLRMRIDYIFVVPAEAEVTVLDSRRVLAEPVRTDTGHLWASDHVGVMAEIAFGGAQIGEAAGD